MVGGIALLCAALIFVLTTGRKHSSSHKSFKGNLAQIEYDLGEMRKERLESNSRSLDMIKVTLAVLILVGLSSPLLAQSAGRRQDGFYSGQTNSQYSGQYYGQVDPRVDGRGSHSEGLPPSAADKSNGIFDNPVSQSDCSEVDSFAPNARPGWQARVRTACNQ
jgi:hypothetical protein